MPKNINLCNMSAKYLVDFTSRNEWMTRATEDVYRSGQLLSEVLPRFEETPSDTEASPEAPIYIKIPEAPKAPVLTARGEADWLTMSKQEAKEFRSEIDRHNKAFMVWCRAPLPRPIPLTDTQLEVLQRVMKFYSSAEDRAKWQEKTKAQELPPAFPGNEFGYQLLKELNLTFAL